MGLFGFVKDVGRKLFNSDEHAAEKIKEHILANNPGVKDLEVEYDDGFVTLNGECTNKEAFQKCVLMAGNVEGVKDVYATGLQAYVPPEAKAEAAPPEPEEEFYVIERGDSLWKIAKKYYSDGNKWPQLFEANKEVILDPDKIFPGQKIRIPKL
ncbi:MAG TPA: peptidoglycan-binding protein LysM [Steroidobacteraceae bacterium]|nr:peptidoglycan-binding protein LysM [Steroidobacteraceae bacterium]